MAKRNQFAFSIKEEGSALRHSYRAHVYGIEARVNRSKNSYGLADISVSGCSFRMRDIPYAVGDTFFIQLEVKGRVILAGIESRVVRLISDEIVACTFENLTERQEYALDKLVLEIQKRIVALNRA